MWAWLKTWWWLRQLRSQDASRNQAAAEWLAGRPEAIPSLVAILQSREKARGDALCRARAATVLGHLKDARAVAPLIAVVEEKSEAVILRLEAAQALGPLDDRRAVPALAAVVRDCGEHAGLRATAASALGALGDARAVPSLLRAVTEETGKVSGHDPFSPLAGVVSCALHALGMLRDPRAYARLAAHCRHPCVSIRRAAILALAELGDRRAIRDLARQPDESAWVDAESALDQLGWNEDVGALAEIVGDVTALPLARKIVAAALGGVNDPRAVEALAAVVLDRGANLAVRAAAVSALGRLGGPRAGDVFCRVMAAEAGALAEDDGDQASFLGVVLDELGRSKGPRAYDVVAPQLAHPCVRLRVRAVQALGELGDPRAVPGLVAIVGGRDLPLDLRQTARLVLSNRFSWKPANDNEKGFLARLKSAEQGRLNGGPCVAVLVFLEGGQPPPADEQQYCRELVRQKYGRAPGSLEAACCVGLRPGVVPEFAYVLGLYGRMRELGRLPDLGEVKDQFVGNDTSGRRVVALFF